MIRIYRYKEEAGFDTPENCRIIEVFNNDADSDCSIVHVIVKPGERTMLHYLKDTAERYVILKGRGEVEIGDDKPVELNKHDVALIPANTHQRITNTGKDELVFLCVCTPRFSPDCYVQVVSE